MARRKHRIDEDVSRRRRYNLRREHRITRRERIKRFVTRTLERSRWSNTMRAKYYGRRLEAWVTRKLIELLPDEMKPEAIRRYLMEIEETENIWEWITVFTARLFEGGYFRYRLLTDIERRVAWKIYETFYESPVAKVVVYTNVFSDVVRDRFFWENFRDYSEYAVYNVINMVSGKIAECPAENVPDPWQRLFIEYYVPFFKRKVCRSGMIAMKITPVTIRFIRGRNGSMYVSRYVPVFVLRSDVWITNSIPTDRHFKVLGWRKEVTEYVSTRCFAGRDVIDYETRIVTARDYLRRDYRIRRFRDVIFRPYTAIHDFARAIGKPEAFIDIDHCSVYTIVGREPKTSRVYRRYKEADDLIRYIAVTKGHGSMKYRY